MPYAQNATTAILVFVLLLSLGVLAVILGIKAAKRRREAIERWCARRGFRFIGSAPFRLMSNLQGIPQFRSGREHKSANVVVGSLKSLGSTLDVYSGDYSYVEDVGSGKNRRRVTRRFSFVVATLPFVTPAVALRRESFLDRFAAAMGFDDIDFETAEFSRKFHVKSQNARFAYDLIHPRMMEFILSADDPSFTITDGLCAVADGARTWPPEKFEQQLSYLDGLLQLWPRHVLDTLQSE
jgi:hypothetical protein